MTAVDTIRLEQLDARIRKVWTRSQSLHLIAGALAFVRWAIPLFLCAVFIDWMTYMPLPGRVVILVVLLGVSLFRAWRCGWRHVRGFDAVRTALQLESHHGQLQSLLVSAIQLRRETNAGTASSALSLHTCQLAEQAAADLQPQQAVPFKPLQRPAVIVALLAVVIVGFATVNGPFFAAGLTRIFTPWVLAEYPTNTQIALEQESLIIKEGEPAQITAQLAGVIPEQATIYVRTGENRARPVDLEVADGACVYTIASASRDFSYRIKAGDDRTAWHDVRVVPAPRIEAVEVKLIYPEYLARKPESIEALTLTVPEGTDVNWRLRLNRPIQSAKLQRDGESPIELGVDPDGQTLKFTADVSASQGYQFTWVDREHGFAFTSPRYFMQVAADQPPRVELTSPASNLVAMLGRPLDLVIRAQDDHGIGSTKVAYRVNQLEETLVDLSAALENGQGEQPIDWDYREALPDLQIGDSVSYAVQVSDRYPQAPHVVRSETRRITFLSKEQYLEQIEKQRDRLLSRVQTIYRQQRAAHELVRELSPDQEGYLQACQLEAIRQEMIREQLQEIAHQMQVLLDDLAANGVADVAQADTLETVRAALQRVAENHIARAADLLRDQSATASSDGQSEGPHEAALAVNSAARELGSLVLLRGIDAAQEVYARETRMLAQAQATLRWQTLSNTDSGKAQLLAEQQSEIAAWTDQLIQDLQSGMRYERRPLAVLRLIRSVKDLRREKTTERMHNASTLISQKQPAQAGAIQADLVRTLLNAEFSVRLTGAYTTLLKTRDQVGSIAALQEQLYLDNESLTSESFTAQRESLARVQTALRKQLLTLMLPTVPAPRASLFDEQPTVAPPVDRLIADADRAMIDALKQLEGGNQQASVQQQQQAYRLLSELLLAVQRWSVEMGLQSQGLGTLVAATSERMSRLEEYEARVITLLEKTDLAAIDEQNVDTLAESQADLAGELADFIKTLKKDDAAEPDRDLPPVLSRLRVAEQSLTAAVDSLKANNADEAIGHQEQAADTLAEAYAIVVTQNERLSLLQDLLMFQRSVGFASGYMADIVAEQRDLLQATEASKPESMAVMLPQFAHMRNCIEAVAPLLDLVAARLDVGTPLVFAKTDFEDAMVSLETGDQFDAIDAQDVAAESLAKVRSLVDEIRSQTGYVAEIVEHLHTSVSDAAVLAYQQSELRRELLAVDQNDLQRFIQAQQALLSQAQQQSKALQATVGSPALVPPADPLLGGPPPTEAVAVFADPAEAMLAAIAALKANDAQAAADEMELASALYAQNAEAMLAVITMLHGLPQVEIVSDTDPELVRLVDVLALASEQKHLFRQTQVADDTAMGALSSTQRGIATRLREITTRGEPHPKLNAASKHLGDAMDVFSPASREKLRASQRAAGEQLRQFIVEQALILDTSIPPPAASSTDLVTDGPGSNTESEVTAGFIADFVSGETPNDKRTEWKVLADRNRAALNQNFARELPLEYRGLLKDYYERVAE